MRRLLFIFAMFVSFIAYGQDELKIFEFDSRVLDFGEFEESKGVVSGVISFKNISGREVVLLGTSTTCRCAEARLLKNVVRPGEFAQVSISYNPDHRPGEFDHEIRVYWDNARNAFPLWIKGNVKGSLHDIYEDRPYSLGNGLVANIKVFRAGNLQSGSRKSIRFLYGNASKNKITLDFEVRGDDKENLILPPACTLNPNQRLDFDVCYCSNETGYHEMKIYPVVNGKKMQAMEFSALVYPRLIQTNFSPATMMTRQKNNIKISNKGNAELEIMCVDTSGDCVTTLEEGLKLKAGQSADFSISGTAGKVYIITNDIRKPYLILDLQ